MEKFFFAMVDTKYNSTQNMNNILRNLKSKTILKSNIILVNKMMK